MSLLLTPFTAFRNRIFYYLLLSRAHIYGQMVRISIV